MNIALFELDEITKPLSLRDERGKHITRILRKREGDVFAAGVINGAAGECLIKSVKDGFIYFEFTEKGGAPPLLPIRLITGFPRPIQLKRLLRDAASIGAESVYLCATETGEKSYLNSASAQPDAARRALIDGCAQAKGTAVPSFKCYESARACLSDVFNGADSSDSPALRIALDVAEKSAAFGRAARPLARALYAELKERRAARVFLAVGSERGWSDAERIDFAEAGFIPCSLGRRILRTETACAAALAITAAVLEETDALRANGSQAL